MLQQGHHHTCARAYQDHVHHVLTFALWHSKLHYYDKTIVNIKPQEISKHKQHRNVKIYKHFYLPLMSELIPSLLTNVLSTASEFVNSSATTYKFGFTFRAASNRY